MCQIRERLRETEHGGGQKKVGAQKGGGQKKGRAKARPKSNREVKPLGVASFGGFIDAFRGGL